MKLSPILLALCFVSCYNQYGLDLNLGRATKITGPVIEKDIQLSGFTGIQLSMNADVWVRPGNAFKIHVKGPQDVVDDLTTFVNSDRYWVIDTERPYQYDWKSGYKPPVEIWIEMPELHGSKVSGSGDLEIVEYFDAVDNYYASVSGSGRLSAKINARELNGKISGSGNMQLEGQTAGYDFKISGSGELDARNFKAQSCYIKISGSGDAVVNVEDDLSAQISGSGDIRYIGRPRVDSQRSGSGSISRL